MIKSQSEEGRRGVNLKNLKNFLNRVKFQVKNAFQGSFFALVAAGLKGHCPPVFWLRVWANSF